jgi:uncharacterized Zn finger protein
MSKITSAYIKSIAPDSKSLTAAKEVADPRRWNELGRTTDEQLWGRYAGSDEYSIYVSVASPPGNHACSCPSRKRPCKHVLGLLLLEVGGHPVPIKAMPPELQDEADGGYYESTWE